MHKHSFHIKPRVAGRIFKTSLAQACSHCDKRGFVEGTPKRSKQPYTPQLFYHKPPMSHNNPFDDVDISTVKNNNYHKRNKKLNIPKEITRNNPRKSWSAPSQRQKTSDCPRKNPKHPIILRQNITKIIQKNNLYKAKSINVRLSVKNTQN